jgi:hypothetical protein
MECVVSIVLEFSGAGSNKLLGEMLSYRGGYVPESVSQSSSS